MRSDILSMVMDLAQPGRDRENLKDLVDALILAPAETATCADTRSNVGRKIDLGKFRTMKFAGH